MFLLRNVQLRHLLRWQKVRENRTFSGAADIQPEKFQRKQRHQLLKVFQDAGLRMRMATVEDGPAILDFLREHFHKEEPLTAAMEVTTSGYGTECKTLDEFCIGQLHQNVSVVCESVDSSLKGFAAVMTCGITDKAKDDLIREKVASAPPLEPLSPTAGPEERNLRIDRFIDTITAEANVFGMYPQLNRLLDSHLTVVHPKYRKHGVCKAIFDYCRFIAEDNGLHLVRVYSTSPVTLPLGERLRVKCVYRYPYSKFKDSEGNQIFKIKDMEEVHVFVFEVNLEQAPKV